MQDPQVLARLKTGPRTVGARQTVKALQRGVARVVFVAKDADPDVVAPVVQLTRGQPVEVVYVESMLALGRACGIDVGASAAAIVTEDPQAKRQRKGG